MKLKALILLALPMTIRTGLPQAQTAALPALEEVVVTASRQPTRINELLSDVTVIGREEIEAAGPAASVDDVLGRQPGVEIYRNGGLGASSSVMIRGAGDKHVVLLVDGVRLNSATSGSPTWSHIPLQEIERIEILRGAASSLYGSDAIGGVIQIFTRKGRGPLRVHAETGSGTHDTRAVNAGFSGSRNGWSYSLQAGHRSTGGISATNRKAGGSFNPDRDRFHQTSASGGLSYTFARDQEAGLKFFHADGRSHYDGRRASDHWRDARLSSFSLYSANRLARFWTSTLRLGRSADEQSNYADGRDDGKLDTEQTQYQWQNDFQLPVGSALLAVERLEEKIDTNPVFGRDERRIDSVIAGWKANIAAHRLQFDLRRDRNSQFGGKTTGFAAYGYQFTPAWRANVSYGTAFRAPTFNDLYYPPRNGMVGNPDLEPETARNKEIAIHYEAGLHHASVTAYQNDVKNLIVWGMSPENVDAARLRGVTLAYDGALYGLDVRASADFQDPRDRGLDKVLLRRSRRHGSLSVGQRRGPFDWNLEWRLSGKRYDDRYRQRLGGYALVNVSAGYRFAPDWTAFVRANNVFDKKYALAYGYDTEGANFFVGIRYQPK